MKILVVQGSGRPKGNMAQLIASFKAGCEESGHSVEVINLIKNEAEAARDAMPAASESPAFRRMPLTAWFRRSGERTVWFLQRRFISGRFPRESRPLSNASIAWLSLTRTRLWGGIRNTRRRTVRCWSLPRMTSSGHLSRSFPIINSIW